MKHKHAEVAIAWLNDQSIKLEYKHPAWKEWDDSLGALDPITHSQYEWRIKPETKPDIVGYFTIAPNSNYDNWPRKKNIKATFDGKTNQLKAVEVI